MCIFLCFSNSELSHIILSKVLAECIVQALRLECNKYIRHCCIILCHTNIGKLHTLSFKACESIINKGSCDFSCSVRTEVEKYNAVLSTDSAFIFKAYGWLNELIGYVFTIGINLFIAFLNSLDRVKCLDTLTKYKCIISLFHSVPVIISVHRIVSANNSSYLTYTDFIQLFNCFCNKILTACRRNITAIHNAVKINLFKSHFLSKLNDCPDM